MPPETPERESEERSIKARKHQLFEEEPKSLVGAAQKPFRDYLRETPAAPFARLVRISLWVVGVLVALLFIASLASSRSRKPVPRAAVPSAPVAPGNQSSSGPFDRLAQGPLLS